MCSESGIMGPTRCGEVGRFWAVGSDFPECEEVGWLIGGCGLFGKLEAFGGM